MCMEKMWALLYLMVLSLQATSCLNFAEDPTALDYLIAEKEQIVERIVSAVEEHFAKRCDYNCSGQCAISGCGSIKPESQTECDTTYGTISIFETCQYVCAQRNLLFHGVTSTSVPDPREDVERTTDECWTRELNPLFDEIYKSDQLAERSLRWQYFGTTSGFYRIYPGYTRRECYTYDPRIRPWYVAATSGPKNVLLLLDVSASMLNNNRSTLAIAAAKTVVETLSIADYVTVITFSDDARQLLIEGQFPNTLVQANGRNIEKLSASINDSIFNPKGQTNFQDAFEVAFNVLDENPVDNSANCHTAILFLTDGYPNRGVTSQQYLIELIRTRNAQAKAVIFAYTFGSSAGAALARGIACETNGVYKHIDEDGGLVEELSQYYNYYTSLINRDGNRNVTWVEPYVDAGGAGMLVTASKTVYDNTSQSARLIGVVGVDILVDDLEIAGFRSGLTLDEVFQRFSTIAQRNECPEITISDCDLELIRESDGGVTCKNLESCPSVTEYTGCQGNPESITYCDYQQSRYESTGSVKDFVEDSCCSANITACDSGSVAGFEYSVMLGFVLACSLVNILIL